MHQDSQQPAFALLGESGEAKLEDYASLLQRPRAELAAWPVSAARYSVEARLGTGTFASCFSAYRYSKFEAPQKVALKVVPRFSSEESRELEIMLLLRERHHDHVVRLHEYFYVASPTRGRHPLLCMVLPVCQASLKEFITICATDSSDSKLAQAAHVGRQLLGALAHVHALGVIHRDVKPDNVLVADIRAAAPRCILSDFGQAKKFGGVGSDDGTRTGQQGCARAFARYYRAPELFFGASSLSAAADVWASGCVLGDVLCAGEPLFAVAPGLPLFGLEATAPTVARVAEALHGAEPGRLDEACRALGRIFTWRPTTRLAATEALDDPFFAQR